MRIILDKNLNMKLIKWCSLEVVFWKFDVLIRIASDVFMKLHTYAAFDFILCF